MKNLGKPLIKIPIGSEEEWRGLCRMIMKPPESHAKTSPKCMPTLREKLEKESGFSLDPEEGVGWNVMHS